MHESLTDFVPTWVWGDALMVGSVPMQVARNSQSSKQGHHRSFSIPDGRSYVGSSTAREQLPDILNRAAYAGERFIISRHGKPVAAVVSVDDLECLEALEDVADLEALRRVKEDPESEFLDWEDVRGELGD